jgi:hypothetical protein
MSLITQKTQIQRDLDAKDQSVLEAAGAMHHLAATLRESNRKFWSLPDDRLLAVLNHDIPQTLATFAANTALGTVVNAQLDALSLPQFPSRAPVEMGRQDVSYDAESGLFVVIPPAEPEPEAE